MTERDGHRIALIFLLAIVIFCATMWGCKTRNTEWDAKFAKNSFASLTQAEEYYIQEDGIYRQSDGQRIMVCKNPPTRIAANEKWVACLTCSNAGSYDAMVYETSTAAVKEYKNVAKGSGEVYLTGDYLLVFGSNRQTTLDLHSRRQIDLPLAWETQFQMDGFFYILRVHSLDTCTIGVLRAMGVEGMTYSVVTSYGNEGKETGSGQAIADITEDMAIIISVKNSNSEQYSVYRVNREGMCTEIAVIPAVHNGDDLMRYQFGKCTKTSRGEHVLTMRKMNGWHKTQTASQSIYTGDDIFIFSADWAEYRMIDLGRKKLIGSHDDQLYYMENLDLYRTTTDNLSQLEFEWLEKLPRNWKHICFFDKGEYDISTQR